MSEEFKAKIRWAGEEAWLKGNLDALDEVYDADYVWQDHHSRMSVDWRRSKKVWQICAVLIPIFKFFMKR